MNRITTRSCLIASTILKGIREEFRCTTAGQQDLCPESVTELVESQCDNQPAMARALIAPHSLQLMAVYICSVQRMHLELLSKPSMHGGLNDTDVLCSSESLAILSTIPCRPTGPPIASSASSPPWGVSTNQSPTCSDSLPYPSPSTLPRAEKAQAHRRGSCRRCHIRVLRQSG